MLLVGLQIKGILNEIKQEAVKANYTDVSFYLHVVPSKTGYYINNWHTTESVQATTNKLIEYISVDDIKKGHLGANYARKTTEICNADYTKAVEAGYADLCDYLERRLKTDVLKGAPTEIKTKEDAIKNIIDGIYAKLQMYKTPMGPNKTIFVK